MAKNSIQFGRLEKMTRSIDNTNRPSRSLKNRYYASNPRPHDCRRRRKWQIGSQQGRGKGSRRRLEHYFTWTSNSIESMGKRAARLNERIEFSLTALILRSGDASTFIPLPRCPNTTNPDATALLGSRTASAGRRTWSRFGTATDASTALRAIAVDWAQVKAVRYSEQIWWCPARSKGFYSWQNYKSTPYFNLLGSMPVRLYDSINERVFLYVTSKRIRKILPSCCAEYRGIFRPSGATMDRAETQNHMREDVASNYLEIGRRMKCPLNLEEKEALSGCALRCWSYPRSACRPRKWKSNDSMPRQKWIFYLILDVRYELASGGIIFF